ncbi:uncharacterized protein LOC132192750 [Neocloeon triangulifer]|uniref:uncharacterized protein LOC132192750 n=1 Tax=Neocloeon triangulifer TaxID=2078957 RepID=UPI00286FA7BE|nr:uncharacterized protein LOC132192750 [Neocloeon triangulifer]
MEWPSRDMFWRVLMACGVVVLFATVFHLQQAHLCGTFALPASIEWDLDGMKEQLEEKLLGQRAVSTQLVNSLQWTLEEAQANQEDTPGLKAIFLLGGPGVGKAKTMQIVTEHVRCRYHGVFGILPCSVNVRTITPVDSGRSQTYSDSSSSTKFTGVHFNTIEMDLAAFNSSHASGFARLEAQIAEKNLSRRVALVSGPVIDFVQLKEIKDAKKYNKFLDQKAKHIAKIMKTSAPRVDIVFVKFEPLKGTHSFLCLVENHHDVDFAFESTYDSLKNDDIYPLGCFSGTNED